MYRWLVIPLVAIVHSPIHAQTVIPDEVVRCPGCEFKITEGVVIGADPANSIYDHTGKWAWRRANGELWLQSGDAPGVIQVVDAKGRNLREFGRRGAGPGEFKRVSVLTCAEQPASAWVYDSDNRRLSLIDQAEDVTTFPPPVGGLISEVVPIGDTLMVASGDFRAPGDVGIELLLFDVRTGQRVGMTGDPSPEVFNRLTNLHRSRVLSRHPDGRIIAAHAWEYVIDLIDPVTLEHQTLIRDAPWFRPRTTVQPEPFREVRLALPLDDRFILTSTVVRVDGYEPSRFREGSIERADYAATMNSIIEIIDLATSRVVFRERRSGQVWGRVCPTGELLEAGFSEVGLPTLTVLTVTR